MPFASIRISNFGEIRQRKLASGEANAGHVAALQSLTISAKGRHGTPRSRDYLTRYFTTSWNTILLPAAEK